MTEICKALSMAPLGGGATMFTRGGQISTPEGAHECALEAGHDGPHAKLILSPLSDTLAMQTTYRWNDVHKLVADVDFIQIETTRKIVEPCGSSTGAS